MTITSTRLKKKTSSTTKSLTRRSRPRGPGQASLIQLRRVSRVLVAGAGYQTEEEARRAREDSFGLSFFRQAALAEYIRCFREPASIRATCADEGDLRG